MLIVVDIPTWGAEVLMARANATGMEFNEVVLDSLDYGVGGDVMASTCRWAFERGHSVRQISERLHLSQTMVEKHVYGR